MKRALAIGAAVAGAAGMATLAGAAALLEFALRTDSGAARAVGRTLNVSADTAQQEAEQRAAANRAQIKPVAQAWYDTASSGVHRLHSRDGLTLVAETYEQPTPTHRWAILSHGFHSSHQDEATFAHEFFSHGYNVLAFDHRAHGQSEGTHTSMGWYERLDLLDWVGWVCARDPQARIVLHGVSMGATTILLALGETVPPQVRCAVADCGFSSLYEEYADKITKATHLPATPLLRAADVVCRARFGFALRQVDARVALRGNTTPVLYVHGTADDFNPHWMLDELWAADPRPRKRRLDVPRARHGTSYYTDPDGYRQTLWEFVAESMT